MTVLVGEKLPYRERLWKILRGLRQFTLDDLATIAEVSRRQVSAYVLLLTEAGYLRRAGMRKEVNGKHQVWRLVKNTGPAAPQPCKCLYDPNIDGVAAAQEVPVEPVAAKQAQTQRPVRVKDFKPLVPGKRKSTNKEDGDGRA